MPGPRDGLDLRSALAILRALRALGARRAPVAWLAAAFPSAAVTAPAAPAATPTSPASSPGLGLVYYSPEQAAEAVALLGRLAGQRARPHASWARRALDKALSCSSASSSAAAAPGGGGGGGGGAAATAATTARSGPSGASARAAAARLSTPLLASLMSATAELGIAPDPSQADALVEEVGRRMSSSSSSSSGKRRGVGGGGAAPPLTQAQLRGVQRALVAWRYRPSHEVGRLQWLAVREASKAWRRGGAGAAHGGEDEGEDEEDEEDEEDAAAAAPSAPNPSPLPKIRVPPRVSESRL
jgi:hypothetical protein